MVLLYNYKTLTFMCPRRTSLNGKSNILSVCYISQCRLICLLHFCAADEHKQCLGALIRVPAHSAQCHKQCLSESQPRADRPAYRNSAHCAQFCATLLCYTIVVSHFSAILLWYHTTLVYYCGTTPLCYIIVVSHYYGIS